ncbi:MAG: hypothetical protein H0U59_09390 [Gemmatimonadaceae bacterium]|nr:hypothetical protein [Gemmatimonadaceae bacterium]
MAYSPTPAGYPSLIAQGIGGKDKLYKYRSADAATVVRAAGYVSNALELGMKIGDTVVSVDTDDATQLQTMHSVVTVNATTGVGDLSDGVGTGANT